MTLGFTLLPSTHLLDNWNSLINGTIPIARGFINSLIVSICTAVLCTYFSAMTAYAINTYQFKARAAVATFILAIMMIPGQVTALGFLRLIVRLGMDDFHRSAYHSCYCFTGYLLLSEAVHGE